ncbi:MAG: tyrosine-type recombinase/integrase, partial [Gammaproteobacteria bacterium]
MLTDTQIRKLKPEHRAYKKFDGDGLYVIVNPDGSKWWRFKYTFGGREKLLSCGTYPDTSLKLARKQRGDARQLLAANIDPSALRQSEKIATAQTFEAMAIEWLAAGCPGGRSKGVDVETVDQLRRRLKTYVFPFVGQWPISKVTTTEMLKLLRRIESNGTFETARRVRNVCSRVFRYAIATGRGERDPAGDLIGAIGAGKSSNFAALTDPKQIGALLRAIDGYQGQPVVMAALKLAPLVFVRPGELRGAEWTEFDLNAKEPEWRIPALRMKMGE